MKKRANDKIISSDSVNWTIREREAMLYAERAWSSDILRFLIFCPWTCFRRSGLTSSYSLIWCVLFVESLQMMRILTALHFTCFCLHCISVLFCQFLPMLKYIWPMEFLLAFFFIFFIAFFIFWKCATCKEQKVVKRQIILQFSFYEYNKIYSV